MEDLWIVKGSVDSVQLRKTSSTRKEGDKLQQQYDRVMQYNRNNLKKMSKKELNALGKSNIHSKAFKNLIFEEKQRRQPRAHNQQAYGNFIDLSSSRGYSDSSIRVQNLER
jgi:hypothetical protein